jgi:putative membrane protein
MDRRNALASLSGVAAASLLLGVSGRPALAQPSAMAATGTPTDAATGPDIKYRMHTMLVGTLSKKLSTLALQRATHPNVKQFAQFEVDEQTTIAQVLSNLANPPPPPLPAAMQAKLAQLQSADAKAFDVNYLQMQVEGHEKLLNVQQAFLDTNPTDRDHAHIAMIARTVIQMHLAMLNDLQKNIGVI